MNKIYLDLYMLDKNAETLLISVNLMIKLFKYFKRRIFTLNQLIQLVQLKIFCQEILYLNKSIYLHLKILLLFGKGYIIM